VSICPSISMCHLPNNLNFEELGDLTPKFVRQISFEFILAILYGANTISSAYFVKYTSYHKHFK